LIIGIFRLTFDTAKYFQEKQVTHCKAFNLLLIKEEEARAVWKIVNAKKANIGNEEVESCNAVIKASRVSSELKQLIEVASQNTPPAFKFNITKRQAEPFKNSTPSNSLQKPVTQPTPSLLEHIPIDNSGSEEDPIMQDIHHLITAKRCGTYTESTYDNVMSSINQKVQKQNQPK